MPTSSKHLSLLVGCVALALFVGCGVNENLSDEGVFTSSKNPLEAIGYFFGGIGLAAAGWFTTQVWMRAGFGMIILGCLGALYMAPAAMFENAVADAEHFVSSQGFMGMTHHEVKTSELDYIEIVTETRHGRRGSVSYDNYMVCHCKGAETKKIQIDGPVQEPAALYYLIHAKDQGIRIVGLE